MKNYKVYIIRDKLNNIVYVGLTGDTLTHRFDDHCQRGRIQRDIHKIELVQEWLTLEQAALLERMLIKQYDLVNKGLNKSYGTSNGCSVIHTEQTKEYLSKINKGKKVSDEHAAKNRVARLGKKNSDKHQQKLVEVLSKPVMCVETGIVYPSIRAAANATGLHHTKIGAVCKGQRKSTGKLHFIYMKR